MPEFWVEENIQPRSQQDMDRLLIDDIAPIIDALKQKGIIHWHFLREGNGWRSNENIMHIRLRVETVSLDQRKKVRRFLKRRLDALLHNNAIIDHYVGNHGKAVRKYEDYYGGEREGFDEQTAEPKGWSLAKQIMETGGEMALLLMRGRLGRVQLAPSYEFYKISHLFPNQCRHFPFVPNIQAGGALLQWPRGWIVYDTINPTP